MNRFSEKSKIIPLEDSLLEEVAGGASVGIGGKQKKTAGNVKTGSVLNLVNNTVSGSNQQLMRFGCKNCGNVFSGNVMQEVIYCPECGEKIELNG